MNNKIENIAKWNNMKYIRFNVIGVSNDILAQAEQSSTVSNWHDNFDRPTNSLSFGANHYFTITCPVDLAKEYLKDISLAKNSTNDVLAAHSGYFGEHDYVMEDTRFCNLCRAMTEEYYKKWMFTNTSSLDIISPIDDSLSNSPIEVGKYDGSQLLGMDDACYANSDDDHLTWENGKLVDSRDPSITLMLAEVTEDFKVFTQPFACIKSKDNKMHLEKSDALVESMMSSHQESICSLLS